MCGAGIAGISTAFHLARFGVSDVAIIDPLPPLTLTSDKSTECYRNWWPNEPMVRLMGRSIDLLDEYARESNNVFGLNRRGYLYLTSNPSTLDQMAKQAAAASQAGAGPIRIHRATADEYMPAPATGFEDSPDGADLFLSGSGLRRHFPYLAANIVGGLHARTAGWLSAQQLGMWLLETAETAGVTLIRDEVTSVVTDGERVAAVETAQNGRLAAGSFVNAAGPHLARVGAMVGVELPVFSEVHAKTAFRDHRRLFPRPAPMIIYNDEQLLDWNPEEAKLLEGSGAGGPHPWPPCGLSRTS